MRALSALFLVLAAGCTSLPETTAPRLAQGLSYSRMAAIAEEVPQQIHVLEIDLARATLEPSPGGPEYRAETTSEFLAGNRLHGAVNGGFFEPFRAGSPGGDDYYPKRGDPVRIVTPRRPGALCIAAAPSIAQGATCPRETRHTFVAGPVLLASGVPQVPADAVRHPRTAVGISADRARAWFVVVDGRQVESAGATLAELAEIFRRLGAADALNLDGGGSSTMVVDERGQARILNSPIHSGMPGRERPSANHLGVRVLSKP